ncbi:MAG: 50S ribosomal protein L11 methyltransferase [Gammaproteobacteria bacterium]|nr:50S ribosomal protein L11 methyltransferase [Gammaproteobacteria bacterium]
MPWQRLIVEVNSNDHELVERCAVELGALSVSLEDAGDQPVLEPAPGETPLWSQMRLIALFPEDVDCNQVSRALTSAGVALPLWERLEDREWARAWLDEFEPMFFGHGLWVCPHGQTPSEAQCVVHLDPGLAFGTGRHATTALCLKWLAGTALRGRTVLDYGCGSGILGLAAAALGAKRVYALDIDDQALIATRDNASNNGLAAQFMVVRPEDYCSEPVDIAIANILARPLISLAGTLAAAVKAGGTVVLSGILDDQADQVRQAYEPWFHMQKPTVHAGWVRLNGIRGTRVHTVS